MDSNTHSDSSPDGLTTLTAAVEQLVAQDLDGCSEAVRAERVLQLRRLLDRLDGHWLKELAALDARRGRRGRGGVQAGSTAGWLRQRLRMGAGAAHSRVRTARALFRGPLPTPATAQADGELSPAHATVLAHGTHDLAADLTAEAEPVLVEPPPPRPAPPAPGHRPPGPGRRPDQATSQAQRRHGLWLASTRDGRSPSTASWRLRPASPARGLGALARPDHRPGPPSGRQRHADTLCELARRALEAGRLPQPGGARPQLTVLSTGTASNAAPAPAAWAATPTWRPWTPRRVGGWPATAPSPGSWSPTTPPTTPIATRTTPTAATATAGWRPGSRRQPPCCPRSWAGPPASPWTWAGPPGS